MRDLARTHPEGVLLDHHAVFTRVLLTSHSPSRRGLRGPSKFCRDLSLQVRVSGTARGSRVPKNARSSAKKSGVFSCVFCCDLTGGFSVCPFLKWATTDFVGGGFVQGGLGAVLRSLVSPQRCTTTGFDVCLICTQLSGQGTHPIT